MDHYVCKGENCNTISDRPSVCLEPGCMNRYKLLEECTCKHRGDHKYAHEAGHHSIKTAGARIHPVHFGIAVGIITGTYFLFLGILSLTVGIGQSIVSSFSSLYIGYDSTLIGSFAGGLWGLIDGFIGGFIIAHLYNFIHKRLI